jgi:hypothetical protein
MDNVTVQTIQLPRSFLLLGTLPMDSLVVTANGAINIHGDTINNDARASPISLASTKDDDPYARIPRIAVAQLGGASVVRDTGAFGSTKQGVFVRDTGNSTIVSWESLWIASRIQLQFQVELYDDAGTMDMRWKYLGSIGDLIQVASGIEDDTLGIAIPAQGLTFNSEGLGQPYPGGSCLRFQLAVPTATPTPVPTRSPTSPPTVSPTSLPTLPPTKVPTRPPKSMKKRPQTRSPSSRPTSIATASPSAVPSATSSSTDVPAALPVSCQQRSYQQSQTCTAFWPIFDLPNTVRLNISSIPGNVQTYANVTLARPFLLLGTERLSQPLIVTVSGTIHLRGDTSATDSGPWPITTMDRNASWESQVSRIAVANLAGSMYPTTLERGVFLYDSGMSVVISWEGFFPPSRSPIHFQIELYDQGDFQLRWGRVRTIAAGIQDGNMAIPVQGSPFQPNGLANSFPANQCVHFHVVAATSCIVTTPTNAPTLQPASSLTLRPQLPSLEPSAGASATLPPASPSLSPSATLPPSSGVSESIPSLAPSSESVATVPPQNRATYVQSNRTCSPMAFIRDNRTAARLDISSITQTPTARVVLTRPFLLLGEYPIQDVVVTQRGTINIHGDTTVSSRPVAISLQSMADDHVPRISVADMSGDIYPASDNNAGVYLQDTGSSQIISWECLAVTLRFTYCFQVELYDTGDLEMRWSGIVPMGESVDVAAGIEDNTTDIAIPAMGSMFDQFGMSSVFPADYCLRFQLTQQQR